MADDRQSPFSEQEVQQRFERIGRDLVEKELYAEAIEDYKDLVRAYPGSRWAANALMGIAECFHHLGQSDQELQTLEAIADQFPDHVIAKRAQAAIRLLRGREPAPASPSQRDAPAGRDFSRQTRGLRLSLLRYSAVGWLLSLIVFGLLVIVWYSLALRQHATEARVADLKDRVAEIADQVDDLHVAILGSEQPQALAPTGRGEVPAQSRDLGPSGPGAGRAATRPAPPPPPAASAPAPRPAPAPAPPPQTGTRLYTIKPGDSLSRIAQRELGSQRRAGEIARLNGLSEPYRIRAGDTLKLPAR